MLKAISVPKSPPRLEGPITPAVAIRAPNPKSRCGVTHVVGEIEVRVVDPDRPPLTEGHEPELLAEAGNAVQPGFDVVAKLEVGRGGPLEQRGRGDVHVRPIPLQMEE